MAKNTYQTYTEDTPISIYRQDFIRRAAMCAALAKRLPDLADIATEGEEVSTDIDKKLSGLQAAEDDLIRAGALEDVEKLDVADVYTELRRTMFAKKYDVSTLLPDAPSVFRRLGADSFAKRADMAVANLKALPSGDPIRAAFLANLEKELAEFHAADKAEDDKRAARNSARIALTLYKAELSQVREAQLGDIQGILKDREKTALFTIPWRKWSRDDEPEAPAQAPAEAGAATPKTP